MIEENLLGVFTDAELGRRWGMHPNSVRAIRTKAGIPVCRNRTAGRKLDEIRHLVGTKSDADIAEMVGVAPSAVTCYRRRNGIAKFGTSARCSDFDKVDKKKVIEMAKAGMSDADIAAKTNRKKNTIAAIRRAAGVYIDGR